MGIYKEDIYLKDSKGNWKLHNEQIVKLSHEVGKQLQNQKVEKASSFDDKTYFVSKPTKGGLNQKVTKMTSYLDDDYKVVRTLITTSSKLGKKDKLKYRGIKGFNKPIKR